MKASHLSLLLLGCCVAAAGCSKEEKTGKLKATVAVARSIAKGQAVSLPLADGDDPALFATGPNFVGKTSFNPTSFKVVIMGMGMCKYHMNTDGSCPDTKDSVYLSNATPIELAGQTALNPLATFENSEIDSGQFGDYQSVTIGFTTLNAVTVSGTATINGTEHTLTEQVVNSPAAVVSVNFPNTLTINEKDEATFSILIDGESPLLLASGNPPAGATALDSTTSVVIPGWSIVPFIGAGTPTVETYDVTFGSTTLGTPGHFGLRITTIKDAAGGLYAASWVPVYTDGYEFVSDAFAPALIENLLTVKTGAGYTLTTDPAKCTATTAGNVIQCLKFPEFTLASHAGTATVGATEVPYTATKR